MFGIFHQRPIIFSRKSFSSPSDKFPHKIFLTTYCCSINIFSFTSESSSTYFWILLMVYGSAPDFFFLHFELVNLHLQQQQYSFQAFTISEKVQDCFTTYPLKKREVNCKTIHNMALNYCYVKHREDVPFPGSHSRTIYY